MKRFKKNCVLSPIGQQKSPLTKRREDEKESEPGRIRKKCSEKEALKNRLLHFSESKNSFSSNPSSRYPSEDLNGFTILEMMIVMLVIALLLLVTLPNIQQKEKIIRAKGCEALLDIVDSQILLYEIDHLETPSDISDLIAEGYLDKGQDRCPDGSEVFIDDGQASH
ncbi:competence type IV pilus major pilin ComGC [Ileibacterium valens]|nr:competence type IV pilus major pilin ComGC [Ileibacterium valens]